MIEIYQLAVGQGTIALSPQPGRGGDYRADLTRLIAWAPDLVVSMTENHELPKGFHMDLRTAGIAVRHFPVADYHVPDPQADWVTAAQNMQDVLARKGRVLVHCMGGCGRSGMAVLRVMIAAGAHPDAALARLRAVRPCAVETTAQRAWAEQG